MNDPGSAHGLTVESLLRQFPIALQEDPASAALAEVTARLLARRPEEIDRLRIYPDIFRLDDKLLDILAYDFKVDWWDPNYTTEEKRRTLADSWHVHKILGTKSAVETAIRDIYPKTNVQEWFEYGGDPYHFKLNIDLSDTFGDETRPWAVLEQVNFYKSLRSHLDEIAFTMTTAPATLHIGGGAGAAVWLDIPKEEDTFDFQYMVSAGGGFGTGSSIVVPKEPDVFGFQASLHPGGSLSGQTQLPIPKDAALPSSSSVLRAGGIPSAQTALPVPEDAVLPPAVTILRTGSVRTIISNRSKGE